MNKKIALGITGVVAVGVLGASALLLPKAVLAENSTNADNFVSILAKKLGVDESKVSTAVSETRTEMHTERVAEYKSDVAAAVKAGKLTQRQADLLNAQMDLDPEVKANAKGNIDPQSLRNLTAEERQAKMEESRTARETAFVAELNAKGLKTTVEELTAAHDAARNAGIMGVGMGMRGGRGGMGMMH